MLTSSWILGLVERGVEEKQCLWGCSLWEMDGCYTAEVRGGALEQYQKRRISLFLWELNCCMSQLGFFKGSQINHYLESMHFFMCIAVIWIILCKYSICTFSVILLYHHFVYMVYLQCVPLLWLKLGSILLSESLTLFLSPCGRSVNMSCVQNKML